MDQDGVGPLRLLGIAGSPRSHGNSEILLDLALESAREAGAQVEKVILSRRKVMHCRACDFCASGRCIQRDDMDLIYPQLESVDSLVLATPVHFYGLPALTKALIDRAQLFWHRKYGSGPPGPVSHSGPRRGALIAVGAARGKQLFVGTRMTVKNWFDTLDIEYSGELLIRGVDERGAVRGNEAALREAASLGKTLATQPAPSTELVPSPAGRPDQ